MHSRSQFFSMGVRSGFLRRLRQLILLGWAVLLISVAPTAYRTLAKLSQMPTGPARQSEVTHLFELAAWTIVGYGQCSASQSL